MFFTKNVFIVPLTMSSLVRTELKPKPKPIDEIEPITPERPNKGKIYNPCKEYKENKEEYYQCKEGLCRKI